MSEQNIKMELAVKSFKANVPTIIDQSNKAVIALSAMTKVETEAEDDAAKLLLGKVKKAFSVVQKLRKEITDPMDVIKKTLIVHEKTIDTGKNSGSEYQRVKVLCDEYAAKVAAEAKAKQDAIQLEANKKIEVARIKSELTKSIELSTLNMIKDGEIWLTNFVSGIILENYDEQLKKLNFKPVLKKESYDKMMKVDYDQKLVSVFEYQNIITELGENYQYDNVNNAYVGQSTKVMDRYKTEVIPMRKTELEALAEMPVENQKELTDAAAKQRIEEVNEKYAVDEEEAIASSEDMAAEAMIDATFEAQVESQSIAEQKGLRTRISYRLKDDVMDKPSAFLDAMIKVITQVVLHDGFDGIVKKDQQGISKIDGKGNPEYVEGVAFWLKQFASLKIDVEITNIEKIEDITTTVKA